MVAEDNKLEKWHLSKSVPISILFFLIMQTFSIVWWASRIDIRVDALEKSRIEHESLNRETNNYNDRRISNLESLLPKIATIEARQGDVIRRLDDNGVKLDRLLGKN